MRALLAAALLLLAGCTSPDPTHTMADGPAFLTYDWQTQASSGFLLLRLEHPDGLQGVFNVTTFFFYRDFVPVQTTLILDNGTVLPLLQGTEMDNAHNIDGDGVVYAGVGEHTVQSPDVSISSWHKQTDTDTIAGPTGAHLLVVWSSLEFPLEITSIWMPGTQVRAVAQGPVVQFELKDFHDGLRIGTPAVGINVGDHRSFAASQVWGNIRLFRSNAAQATLTIDTTTDRHVVDLAYDCPLASCGSTFDTRRIHFSSLDEAAISLEVVGNTRQLKVLGTVALLPVAVLPVLWLEQEEAFP